MQLFALSAIIIQVWIFKVHILHAFYCNYCLYCSSDLVWYWPDPQPLRKIKQILDSWKKNKNKYRSGSWIQTPLSSFKSTQCSVMKSIKPGFLCTLLCVKWWGRFISWIKLTWRVRIQRLARRLRVRKCVRVWGMKTESLFLYVLVRFERTECFYKIWS